MLVFLFRCLYHRNETTSLLCLAPVVGWQETLDGGECLEQLFRGKIQENISDFSVDVQIHIKSHWPISC